MKKRIQSLISLLLVLTIITSAGAMSAFAAESTEPVSDDPVSDNPVYEELFDGQLTIAPPIGLTKMSEEMVKKKYSGHKGIPYAWSNEDGSVAFAVSNILDYRLSDKDVFEFAVGLRVFNQSTKTANIYHDIDKVKLKNTAVGYFDYYSDVFDGRAYILFFAVPVEKGVVLGSFSCPQEKLYDWEPLFFKSIKSISVPEGALDNVKPGNAEDFLKDDEPWSLHTILGGRMNVERPRKNEQAKEQFAGVGVNAPADLVAAASGLNFANLDISKNQDEDERKAVAPPNPKRQKESGLVEKYVTLEEDESPEAIAKRMYGDSDKAARIVAQNKYLMKDGAFAKGQKLAIPYAESVKIQIDEKDWSFDRRSLGGGKFSAIIPKSFKTLPEEYAKRKYPSDDRPEIILTDNSTTIALAFSLSEDEEVAPDKIYGETYYSVDIMQSMYPEYRFSSIDYRMLNDTTIASYSFTGNGIDEQIFNVFFYTTIDGKFLQGFFSCPAEEKDEWKPYFYEIMYSIR